MAATKCLGLHVSSTHYTVAVFSKKRNAKKAQFHCQCKRLKVPQKSTWHAAVTDFLPRLEHFYAILKYYLILLLNSN